MKVHHQKVDSGQNYESSIRGKLLINLHSGDQVPLSSSYQNTRNNKTIKKRSFCFVSRSAKSFSELDRNYLTPFFTSNNGDYDEDDDINDDQHHGNNILMIISRPHYYMLYCFSTTMEF